MENRKKYIKLKKQIKHFENNTKTDKIGFRLMLTGQVVILISIFFLSVIGFLFYELISIVSFAIGILTVMIWFLMFMWILQQLKTTYTHKYKITNGFLLILFGFQVFIICINMLLNSLIITGASWMLILIIMIYQIYNMKFNM